MDSDTDDDVNLNDTEDDSSDYSFKSCTENEEEDVSTTLGVRETTVTLGDTSAIPSMKETSSCEDPSTTDEEAGGVGEGSAANYGETSSGIEESVRGAEGTSSTTSVGQLCIPGLETTTGAETVVYTRGAEPTRSSLVPSCSGSTPVHQVGGSVATNMAQTNWKASGDQILEVALFKKAKDSDYTLSMETVKQELSGAKEVHFNMTKTDIYEPTAVAIGGDVRVGPETQAPPTALQQLKSKTERTYKDWTEGMVETKATKTILNKIAAGRTWVTVTGCPGEGKTTAGYFVLKHLHDRGREVFDVKTPKDFLKVKESKQSVIMLNDIFGALSYDPDSIKKWQNVLSDVLALSEHKEDAKDESHKAKKKRIPELTVILISRLSVLKEAGEDLGKYKHLVLSEDNVVNLTKAESETSERMKIWMCYAERYDITIDSRLVREICNLKLSHGFPHCCKLFAAMYSENNQLKMRDFFLKPLEFLNQSMESLLKDPLTGPLLREMLKNDGSLYLESVDDFERRYQYSSVAESLRDTYLFLKWVEY